MDFNKKEIVGSKYGMTTNLLQQFRDTVYQALPKRADATIDLLDALTAAIALPRGVLVSPSFSRSSGGNKEINDNPRSDKPAMSAFAAAAVSQRQAKPDCLGSAHIIFSLRFENVWVPWLIAPGCATVYERRRYAAPTDVGTSATWLRPTSCGADVSRPLAAPP